MRSYYEAFGETVVSDSNGESEQPFANGYPGDGAAGRRSPDNAGTGGISSDSRDRGDEPWWREDSREQTPMRQPAWDGWSEDGSYGSHDQGGRRGQYPRKRGKEGWRHLQHLSPNLPCPGPGELC